MKRKKTPPDLCIGLARKRTSARSSRAHQRTKIIRQNCMWHSRATTLRPARLGSRLAAGADATTPCIKLNSIYRICFIADAAARAHILLHFVLRVCTRSLVCDPRILFPFVFIVAFNRRESLCGGGAHSTTHTHTPAPLVAQHPVGGRAHTRTHSSKVPRAWILPINGALRPRICAIAINNMVRNICNCIVFRRVYKPRTRVQMCVREQPPYNVAERMRCAEISHPI